MSVSVLSLDNRIIKKGSGVCMSFENKLKKVCILTALLGVITGLGFNIIDKVGRQRSIANIPEPVQTPVHDYNAIAIDDMRAAVEYKYEYDIEALVVSTHDYNSGSYGDKMAPRDLALAWEAVAQYNTYYDFKWWQNNRFVYFSTNKDLSMISEYGDVGTMLSNNHIVPANDEIRWKLMTVRTGDHIRLKGYLVDIDGYTPSGGIFTWHSSTSRYDSGNGACEVIYTTSIEWL